MLVSTVFCYCVFTFSMGIVSCGTNFTFLQFYEFKNYRPVDERRAYEDRLFNLFDLSRCCVVMYLHSVIPTLPPFEICAQIYCVTIKLFILHHKPVSKHQTQHINEPNT